MKKLTLLFLLGLCLTGLNAKTFYTVHFGYDEFRALSEVNSISLKLKEKIKSGQFNSIKLIGHTDSIGSSFYNKSLSLKRARFVRDVLRVQLKGCKFSIEAKGEEAPKASNTSENGRRKNRRVEILLEKIDAKSEVKELSVFSKQNTIQSTSEVQMVQMVDYTKIKAVLPDGAKKPTESCRAFFSGVLVVDHFENNWFSKAFKVDRFSEYVGEGEYYDLSLAMPRAVGTSFDGIAIGAGTRVVIYSKKNFKGKVLLDVTGPKIINNSMFKPAKGKQVEKDFKDKKLQALFPQKVRMWSKGNMNTWSQGSLKITCNKKD